MQESLFSLRENLLLGQPQSQTNVLVSPTRVAPDGGDLLLASAVKRLSDHFGVIARQIARAWVDAYCQQVLKPLFAAEADYDPVLLAHQQNILVQMLRDLPVEFIYHNHQGSAFMSHAAEWLDTTGKAWAESIFTRRQLLRYFPYYLLVNSTSAVTAVLGAAELDSETSLMARVRTLPAEVRDQVTHRTCLDYVLENLYWNVKGSFFCYLNDHNKNIIVDPPVIYFDFVDPLQAQEV